MRNLERVAKMLGGVAFCVSLTVACAANAADKRVTAAFGNTVLSTYPDGRSQKVWLHSDGSWTGAARDGRALAGKWRLTADKVCLRQSQPPTLPFSMCLPFPAGAKVGSTWAANDFGGTPIRLKVVRGIQTRTVKATK